jgi:hypothetical protein
LASGDNEKHKANRDLENMVAEISVKEPELACGRMRGHETGEASSPAKQAGDAILDQLVPGKMAQTRLPSRAPELLEIIV